MIMASVLVTGSNRGLGFEWVRQYAAEGWRVYATCRHPAEAWDLHEVASKQTNVSIHRLDVTKPDEVNAIAAELLNESVDIVINNAGVYFEKYAPVGLKKLRYEDWEYAFRVNTMGAVRLSEAFLGHLARSEKRLVVAISTHMGSITQTAGNRSSHPPPGLGQDPDGRLEYVSAATGKRGRDERADRTLHLGRYRTLFFVLRRRNAVVRACTF